VTKLDRILASVLLTARAGNGGGVVLLLFAVPIGLVIGLAVLLVKGLVRGGVWCFGQAGKAVR
jgi:hypothetical protein